MTSYGSPPPFERGQTGLILPLSLQHLTPPYISVIGIGAVAAAVMSSTDSALLSAASIFSSNIYKKILRTKVKMKTREWKVIKRVHQWPFVPSGAATLIHHWTDGNVAVSLSSFRISVLLKQAAQVEMPVLKLIAFLKGSMGMWNKQGHWQGIGTEFSLHVDLKCYQNIQF